MSTLFLLSNEHNWLDVGIRQIPSMNFKRNKDAITEEKGMMGDGGERRHDESTTLRAFCVGHVNIQGSFFKS